MDLEQFEQRKREHLALALAPKHQSTHGASWGRVHLNHEALPDLDINEINLETQSPIFGTRKPFFVAGMTAGHPDAVKINLRIAKAVARRGWIMGVGSQRREFVEPQATQESKTLKAEAGDALFLIGNLGIAQLVSFGVERVLRWLESAPIDGLAVHLNALQEALQPEGTPEFRGGAKALEYLVKGASKPVVLKETGCGFSRSTLERLPGGLAAVDLSGRGGTHWGRIEGARAPEGSRFAKAAVTFADWGETLVDALLAASQVSFQETEVWASGGVRTGLDAAKAFSLGADRVGFARPVLEAALESEACLEEWMEQVEYELRVACFCTGAATVPALRGRSKCVEEERT